MDGFLEMNRNPKGVDTSDPRFKQRVALQSAANLKISDRQRHVLPDGRTCALVSVQVPWAPFQYYLDNKCAAAKPFLWTNTISVGTTEWVMFFGIEPMEAERRDSLWVGICNNLASPVCAYTKCDLLVPSTSMELGDVKTIGEAVDNLVPCGAEVQKNKFGRFWWHKSPEDLRPMLFRGLGDAESERSFEVLLTIKLNPEDKTERTLAHKEDPKLWELSKKYLQPWVDARCSGVADPLRRRIRELEREVAAEKKKGVDMQKAERDRADSMIASLKEQHAGELRTAKEREESAVAREKAAQAEYVSMQARAAAADKAYGDMKAHADQLQVNFTKLERLIGMLTSEKAALADTVKGHEQNAKIVETREQQLRNWGQGLQAIVTRARDAEEAQVRQVRKLEEYIKNTKTREDRYTTAIAELEGKLKSAGHAQHHLQTQVAAMESQLNQARDREDELRSSNARLYMANADEQLRTQAMSLSPHHASPRHDRGASPMPPPAGY